MKTIIHIGNYKTGTSALQNFLFKNSDRLMEYGIYYGNVWKIVNNHAGFAFALLKEALEYIGKEELCPELKEVDLNPAAQYNKMQFIAENRGAKKLIISHEGLFADLLQMSAGLFSNSSSDITKQVNSYIRHRVKEIIPEAEIVCYLRRQDKYIESMYSEYCKVPWRENELPVTIDEFMEKNILCLNYYDEIKEWKELFGDNVKINIYERNKLYKNDIVADFFHKYIGISEMDFEKMEKNQLSELNSSLCRDALEHKLEKKVNEPILNYLYKVYSENYPDKKKYGILSNLERTSIIEKYRVSNNKIFETGEEVFDIQDYGAEYQPYNGLTNSSRERIERWLDNACRGGV